MRCCFSIVWSVWLTWASQVAVLCKISRAAVSITVWQVGTGQHWPMAKTTNLKQISFNLPSNRFLSPTHQQRVVNMSMRQIFEQNLSQFFHNGESRVVLQLLHDLFMRMKPYPQSCPVVSANQNAKKGWAMPGAMRGVKVRWHPGLQQFRCNAQLLGPWRRSGAFVESSTTHYMLRLSLKRVAWPSISATTAGVGQSW